MELREITIKASILAIGMLSMPAFALLDGIDPDLVDTDAGAVIPGTDGVPEISGVDTNGVPVGPGVPGVDDLSDGIPLDPTMTIVVPGNLEVPQRCVELGITPDLKRGGAWTQINSPMGSMLITYDRNPQTGRLCEVSIQPTRGFGDTTGIVTSAQNNVVNYGNRCVYVANPGGDPMAFSQTQNMHGTISVFKINAEDSQFISIHDSHGPNPRAIAFHEWTLYVVNAGVGAGLFGPNVSAVRESIQGYRISREDCSLTEIPGSFNVTNDHEGDPGDLNFTVNGNHLIVAQRRTTFAFGSGLEPSNAEVFPVLGPSAARITGTPVVNDIQEQGPFGFRTYVRGGEQRSVHTHGNFQLIASGGTSSWRINADSTMTPQTTSITGDDSPNVVENGGSDTCWNVLSHNNRWVYTSAFFDSAFQYHRINLNGSLQAAQPAGGPGGVSSSSPNGPNANMYSADQGGLDMGRSDARFGNQFIYVMNNPVPPPLGIPVTTILPARVMNGRKGGPVQALENFRIYNIPNNAHGLAVY